jgi:competence protein ComEC
MRLAALAFACGVWLLQTQAKLPSAPVCAALLALALGCGTLAWWLPRRIAVSHADRTPRLTRALLAALTAFLLGFLWAAGYAHWRMADAIDPAWEGRDIVVTGIVSDLPQPFERGVGMDFEVESAIPPQAHVPGHISLAWYNGLSPEEFQEVQPVRAGERWRFTVKLRRPHGTANPHGFDLEAWMLENGTRATGTVTPRGEHERLDGLALCPTCLVARLREVLRQRVWDLLSGRPYAGVLTALAIGDQRAIDNDQWQVFARTGVSHLMSISGLHVTMVAGLFGTAVFFLWPRLSWRGRALALRLPAQKAAAVAAAFGALAYCLLSGYQVPAQRTLYMVAVVAVALWLDRMSSASRLLAVALVAVLLLDPWAVLAPGFWLSFGAVALIFYVMTGRTAERGWLAQWGAVQWAVTIGLAPATLLLFGQVSLVSPLANAVAIPVVSAVVTPLALAGVVMPFDLPASWLLGLARWITEWLMVFLTWLSHLDGAVWQQHAPAAWTLPVAMIGILWLLAPRGFPGRAIGLVLLAPLYAVVPAAPAPGAVTLAVLDVGQGLATVVRTHSHALVYDTGPRFSPQSDSGARIVVPYLRGEGINALDVVAVSHEDNDHAGGAPAIMAAIPAARLVSSLDGMQELADAREAAPGSTRSLVPWRERCRAGETWTWDGVRFTWLFPDKHELDQPWLPPNGRSCVLRIDAKGGSALLPGDIEKDAERALLERGAPLAADILVVPHHGSLTSSTPAFVQAVAPREAVFAVGYRNRFGHPRADVWARYESGGVQAERWRSDRDGEVSFNIGTDGIQARAWRDEAARYWREETRTQ